MGRPAKSVDVLTSTKSSHLTKDEIRTRKAAESAGLSGTKLRERAEVKSDPVAHAEFLRVSRLLTKVGKNDAMFEPIINRYCQLQSECATFEKMREEFEADLKELRANVEIEDGTRYRLKAKMQDAILNADKQIQQKRKMLFDIERECGMTVSSAVRIVPKAAPKETNPLLEILGGD